MHMISNENSITNCTMESIKFVTTWLCTALMIGLDSSVVQSADVLFFNGMGEGSHYTAAAHIGEALTARGISVTFLIGDTFKSRSLHPLHSKLFDFEIIPTNSTEEQVANRMEPLVSSVFRGESVFQTIKHYKGILEELSQDCESLFQDAEILQRLKDRQFDLIVYDTAWPCTALLAEYLNIPKVSFIPAAFIAGFVRIHGNQLNPALVAEAGLGFPSKMNFMTRLNNVLVIMVHELMLMTDNGCESIRKRYNIQNGWRETMETTSMVLASSDPLIDQWVPTMPHVVMVGGITTKPANALEKDLEDFMQSSGEHGVIIFTLGSYVTQLPDEFVKHFQRAFEKLPQKVIWQWKHRNPPTNMPGNVKTMSWLPQNDLLGHSKTRLLIYQGGNNGLYEAIYHAVPLLVMPFIGDQPDVAQRVVERGVGLKLDVMEITSESVVQGAITDILTDKKYKSNIVLISAMFRDRPDTPIERAAFWIEHVLKHGADHLRSPVHDLNFIQLNMLDVYGFLAICSVLVLYIVYRLLRFVLGLLCRLCCGGTKTKKD